MSCDCSDLSSVDSLQDVVVELFNSPNEEMRSAASYALGVCEDARERERGREGEREREGEKEGGRQEEKQGDS